MCAEMCEGSCAGINQARNQGSIPQRKNLMPPVTASLPVHLTQSLRWNSSFYDSELERKYTEDWWFQTCMILRHMRVIAVIEFCVIIVYAFGVNGQRMLVTQILALCQLLLSVCLVYWHKEDVQQAGSGPNLVLAAVFTPLMVVWMLAWMFQGGFMAGGWCNFDLARWSANGSEGHDMEVFCQGTPMPSPTLSLTR